MSLKFSVVYKFNCAACGNPVCGQDLSLFINKVKEHLAFDENSHIFKHLNNNSNCKNKLLQTVLKLLIPTILLSNLK